MAVEPAAASVGPHAYSHPLIDWGAALAGTAIAVTIGVVLVILGVAVGATTINPWETASEQAPAWTIGGGLYLAFANLVALQLGAFVAVRAARWPDHHSGLLQGILVWALAFLLAAGVLGLGVGGLLTGAASGEQLGRAVTDAAQAATGEATGAAAPLSPAETDALQDATAVGAWWAFGTLALGAVGAVAGGRLGYDHPNWHARDRMPRATTMADQI
jgi:hypothetical protein